MCGIAGCYFPGGRNRDGLRDAVTRMTRSLHHRGPEAGGIWLDHKSGLAFGHRRLAILDLTSAGHQPFFSASGRFVVTFNGEIYNFAELRKKLDHPFSTRTDTEVLVAAIESWGLERTLPRLDGMFAFAVWDRQTHELALARDRMGEKPLFFARSAHGIYFASETRAFEALPDFPLSIDPVAREHFLNFGYISGPRTMWRGIESLPPGHVLRGEGAPQRYLELCPAGRFSGGETEAVSELGRLLEQSVRSRLIADVPAGVFLSGGVDSSLIAAYATGVSTFTIGFEEGDFDESAQAREVAGVLGTQHHEWRISPTEALTVIPDLPAVFDQPFGDSSQIPALLLARRARQHVTVALGGDGGDELFAAYPRYRQIERLHRIPRWMRQALAAAGSLGAGEKSLLLSESARAEDLASLYSGIMGGTVQPEESPDAVAWMCGHDLSNYLPDDLLVKLDRSTMSVALESRLPFLAPGVVDFAKSLPRGLRLGKRIPRALLRRHLPPHLVDRPKRGFRVPIAEWLRGPLRPWAEELVPGITDQIPAGSRCVRVWSRLMFEAWLTRRGVRPVPGDRPLAQVGAPD